MKLIERPPAKRLDRLALGGGEVRRVGGEPIDARDKVPFVAVVPLSIPFQLDTTMPHLVAQCDVGEPRLFEDLSPGRILEVFTLLERATGRVPELSTRIPTREQQAAVVLVQQ